MKQPPRTLIPMPRLRKDQRAGELEIQIDKLLTEYFTLAPAARAALFMNGLMHKARRKGLTAKALSDPHKPIEESDGSV